MSNRNTDNKATTADANADQVEAAKADVAAAMREAQAVQEANAEAMVSARDLTTPDATYARGVEGANVNIAAPKDAPVISTYEDALEAGYFGVAAGHANTDKLSVAAVTERDRKLGLIGRSAVKGAVVNGAGTDAAAAKTDSK